MFRSFSFSTRAVSVFFVALTAFLVFGSDLVGPAFTQQQTTKPTPPASSAGFSVSITYSQKAMDTLVAGKETVVVAGYLYGFPLQGTPKKYVDHMGEISVGDDIKQEISPGAISTFGAIKFDEAMLKWMDSRGPQIVINVYSGRKSSPNNLLDCGFYEGPLKAIQGTSLPISCKLIGE